jgi:hypothetical protein
MREAILTIKPAADTDTDQVIRLQSFAVPITGEHRITVTADGDSDVQGFLAPAMGAFLVLDFAVGFIIGYGSVKAIKADGPKGDYPPPVTGGQQPC